MSRLEAARDLVPRLWREARAMTLRELVRGVVDRYREGAVMIYASALSFRAFLALIPLLLFVLGLLGFLGLDDLWTRELAPSLRESTSPAAFTVVDDTVETVLGQGQLFWVTIGLGIAVLQVSHAVRAVMKAFNEIYDAEEERPVRRQLLVSLALAACVIVLVLAAIASVRLGGAAVSAVLGDGIVAGVIGFILRWGVAILLLAAVIGLLVRAGPDRGRPFRWVTFGAVLVIVLWIAGSLVFGLYLTYLADYGSVFGNLASAFILLEYLFLSALALLTGSLVDAMVRDRVERRG